MIQIGGARRSRSVPEGIPLGLLGTLDVPFHLPFAHALELRDIADDGSDVDRVPGRALGRSRPVAAEGARDLVEAIDLRENPTDVLVEHAFVVDSPITVGALEMLHAKPDRRERVLDLVRHLACHLAPGEDALCARELRDIVEGQHHASLTRQPRQASMNLSPVKLEVEFLLVTTPLDRSLPALGASNELTHALDELTRPDVR